MRKRISKYIFILLSIVLAGCSEHTVQLTEQNLILVNREILAIDEEANTIVLNDRLGDGLGIIKGVNFDVGTIEIELKGEDIQGKSFVGIAFNVQNDSTYEAVYFRPFNFQSEENIRREHSLQYIYHPKHTWRFLRTNHEGQYEAEFPRRPSPEDWFRIQVKIDSRNVHVYDKVSDTKLLSVERLAEQSSDKIALWTGFNSKGAFRNLKIKK